MANKMKVVGIVLLSISAAMAIEQGELVYPNVDSSTVVTMMDGDSKSWFQLVNDSSHPEAFWRYFVSDPDRRDLNAFVTSTTWKSSDAEKLASEGELDQVLNKVSIAEYESVVQVKDVGETKVKISAMVFDCLDQDCNAFAPTVLNVSSGRIYSVWRVLYASDNRSIMLNAIPADVLDGYSAANRSERELRELKMIENRMIPDCDAKADSLVTNSVTAGYTILLGSLVGDETVMRMFAERTAIEGTYPWQDIDGCYQLNLTALRRMSDYVGVDLGGFGDTLVVLGFSISGGYTQNSFTEILRSFLEGFSVESEMNCSSSSRMLINNIGEDSFTVCSAANATGFSRCWITRVELNSSLACTNLSVEFMQRNLRPETTDPLLDDLVKKMFRECFAVSEFHLPTLPRTVNVTETSSSNSNLCRRDLALSVNYGTLSVLLGGESTSFLKQHKAAFELEHGKPTEFWTGVLTMIAAFVSILGTTGPLTRFELLLMRKMGYLQPSFRTLKLVSLVCINSAITFFLFYFPVILLVKDEIARQEEFKTWTLVSNDDFETVIPSKRALKTMALLVITGKSVYHCKFLPLGYILCTATPLSVAVITITRCLKALPFKAPALDQTSQSQDVQAQAQHSQ